MGQAKHSTASQITGSRRRTIRPKIKQSTTKIKIRYLALAIMALTGALAAAMPHQVTRAESCPDLKVIFVRGSGGERYTSGHYLAFKEAMEAKLRTSNLLYEIDDLDYPAIGIDNIGVLVGAYIGGGDSYEFGDSVHQGISNLVAAVNHGCSTTKYVVAGYSQGALVVSDALAQMDASKVAYAATFGDPKIYLPEGAGPVPAACAGQNLSEYRAYVPDCRAYRGLMGAKNPYVPQGYAGKVGTWCNKKDIFCSSYLSIRDHTHYVEDGLYEDASRKIFSKIAEQFGFQNEYTSPHDTAILIDSTGSMSGLIDQYKAEAMNLAEQTLDAGGRVALYDYRDLGDGYSPVERCNFTTCTAESFQAGLNAISTDGGGDTPESLLSASFHVMQALDWNFGSTKSMVILTDAGYHSPDLDGITFYDVKRLSQQIDPVNFYIITTEENINTYQELAAATDGAVAASVDDLSMLTTTIMQRYDSLPRVEEEPEDATADIPVLDITSTEDTSEGTRITFTTTGTRTIVILNDTILGTTELNEITITGLNRSKQNIVTLVPLSETRRGVANSASIKPLAGYGGTASNPVSSPITNMVVPKAPNTGKQ